MTQLYEMTQPQLCHFRIASCCSLFPYFLQQWSLPIPFQLQNFCFKSQFAFYITRCISTCIWQIYVNAGMSQKQGLNFINQLVSQLAMSFPNSSPLLLVSLAVINPYSFLNLKFLLSKLCMYAMYAYMYVCMHVQYCSIITSCLHECYHTVFKPGPCRPAAGAPGFLKLILCGLSVSVRVCVHTPKAINNQWHDVA